MGKTTAMSERLGPQPGERIDREQPVGFVFEGRRFQGYRGDTLSTALWASGVRVLGRSFKYHRPRGIFSLCGLDCNALAENRDSTNLRMDTTPIEPGLEVKAVNTWGGVQSDLYRFTELFSAFLPVGFYYKAFHRPRALFPFYERCMRRIAGLGNVHPDEPLQPTPKRYDFCDLLVVGSGPAGLSAAVAAAELGLKVLLVEEDRLPGGTLGFQLPGDPEARALLEQLLGKATALPNLELRTGTTAAGCYADHWLALIDSRRLTKLRARSLVVAAGCYDQPAVFRNNDLPGVMLASAAQRLIHQYAVKPFRQAVVVTANTDGYRAAVDLHRAGVKVALVSDLRPQGETSTWKEEVAGRRIPIRPGTAIYEALPAPGKRAIRGALLCPQNGRGDPLPDQSEPISCDGIAMSVGWTPADSILRQAGACMRYAESLEQYVPDRLPPGVFAAGRVNGIYALGDQLEDGRRAGRQAAAHLGKAAPEAPAASQRRGPAFSHPYPVFPHPRGKNFVDLDEDIQLDDIRNSVQEGFDSAELLKRYSTLGMGPSQGKHSNLNGARILARLKGKSLAATGLTTARPFTSPVPLSHLAGRIFSPQRRTPLHARHRQLGARFMVAGIWLRPEYYPVPGASRRAAIQAEAEAVRRRVGVVDVGTLGKLEICGPDAVAFMERMYTGRFARLREGRSRYVLMCDESGMMVDDGVAARLASDRFYVTTTSGASDAVAREMTRWALIWSLQVMVLNLTGMYGAMNLAGPRSLQILQSLTDIDLDPEAFPYLGVRQGRVAGARARVLRVGFVGEWGYEIHVPADAAVGVWDRLLEAGRAGGIRPFGVEAQRLLRLEKGHLIMGQDSDGLSYPGEAGLEWAVKADKPFFLGQRSLSILGARPLNRRLVGFAFPEAYAGPLPRECELVIHRGEIAGRVTSAAFSPTLKQVIGMAYVSPARSEPGTAVRIRTGGRRVVTARVVKLPFYDPGNLRQKQAPDRISHRGA